LIGGVVIGLLGNLPVLNLINCLLCIWVWVGGVLSVFLYRRLQQGQLGLTPAQGAGLGAIAGLVGALFGALVYALTSSLSTPLFNSIARLFQVEGDLPFQSGDLWGLLISTLIFCTVDAVLYPVFGALSGFLTVSLLQGRTRPASAG
jgi:hypothetical protein